MTNYLRRYLYFSVDTSSFQIYHFYMSHKNILDFFTPPNPFSPDGIFGKIIHPKTKEEPSSQSIRKIKNNGFIFSIIRNPNHQTISFLKRKYRFHPIHLDDIVSSIQRPKIDMEDKYIFFVLHFPSFNETTRKIESKEIDFFLTETDLIAVVNKPFAPLEDFIVSITKKKKERERFFREGVGVALYLVIDKMVDAVFPLLDQMEKGLEVIDSHVFSSAPKNVAEQLSFLRRNVIFFQTTIRPQLNSFVRLKEEKHYLLNRSLKTYFSNITDHLKKIWDRLEDVKELSDNLSVAFEGYLSFKTNEIIKVLTVFSVVLLPLTLLSGIYGMNLAFLPLADHPMAIVLISSFMAGIVFLMLFFFRLKHWI